MRRAHRYFFCNLYRPRYFTAVFFQKSGKLAVAHLGRDYDGNCHDIGDEHHDREDVKVAFRPDHECGKHDRVMNQIERERVIGKEFYGADNQIRRDQSSGLRGRQHREEKNHKVAYVRTLYSEPALVTRKKQEAAQSARNSDVQ